MNTKTYISLSEFFKAHPSGFFTFYEYVPDLEVLKPTVCGSSNAIISFLPRNTRITACVPYNSSSYLVIYYIP